MQHIPPLHSTEYPLYDAQGIRALEAAALSQRPEHHLMQAAATAVFRLGRALYPHARRVWVACGPGNNGGDGLLAAAAWHQTLGPLGVEVCVTWTGDESRLPADARFALTQARLAGVRFVPESPRGFDLAVDALLGLGVRATTSGPIAQQIAQLQASLAPVLCVDLPSGLHPDTGQWLNPCPAAPAGPRHTLTFLGLKPGLFTASGKEVAGDIWLDELDGSPSVKQSAKPRAVLLGKPMTNRHRQTRHDAHKGSHGDVTVLGGQDVRFNGHGMTGAALLAARASMKTGAGRVYVGLLGAPGDPSPTLDPLWPELMFRTPEELLPPNALQQTVTVCGCGGGQAVHGILPTVLQHSKRLVLDADALNAIAATNAWQTQLAQRALHGAATILTPHPLEAARLLNCTAAAIQSQRLEAVDELAQKFQCVVVLKGSGTVIAAPGRLPGINPTGNALLATAGTGDVLAGMLGGYWCSQTQVPSAEASMQAAWNTAHEAVYAHGSIANLWHGQTGFTASRLLDELPCN